MGHKTYSVHIHTSLVLGMIVEVLFHRVVSCCGYGEVDAYSLPGMWTSKHAER